MDSKILSTPVNTAEQAPRLGYIGALDGLRALAVLAVLLYHADVLWLPGGYLGVEIFFVVSGYLITSLLLAEYRAHNQINFKQFWVRRARRLLPALFALLIGVMTYAVIFLPEEVASLRGDVLAAFTYITNWYLIAAEKSYFEVAGRPSMLRHLWSLAVEEQFYLIWPLVFALILTRLRTRGALLLLMLGGVASALWMGFQYQPDTDPSRIYYGTDTRAAGLLIGSALAFVWIPKAGGENFATRKSRLGRWLLEMVGIAAFAALVYAGLTLSEFDPFLYQGGMLLVGAATAFVIAAVVSPASPIFGPILAFGVLRWIGLRSYSLYLWHWPVFMVTRPQLDTTLDGLPLLFLRFALTFALAEISYRVIESPIRKGALGRAWETWNSAQGARRWGLGLAWMGIVAAFVMGAFLLGSAVVRAQPAPEPDYVLEVPADEDVVVQEAPIQNAPLAPTTNVDASEPSDMTSVSLILPAEQEPVASVRVVPQPVQDSWVTMTRSSRTPLVNSNQAEMTQRRQDRIANGPRVARITPPCNAACQARVELAQMKEGMIRPAKTKLRPVAKKITPQPTKPTSSVQSVVPITPPQDAQVLALGDSVMLGASNYLRKTISAVDVDAKMGRQVSAALKILRERQSVNLLPQVVIVHLGNNGTFTSKQFDEMMTLLRDVPQVIFLTNKVPRKWQTPNNIALAEGVAKYSNATLVDWNGASSTHPEWFWQDGIHLNPDGARVYANLIAQVIAQAQ